MSDRTATQQSTYVRKWKIRGDTGELVPEIDLEQSEIGGFASQATAYDTDAVAISDANIPAGKKFLLKNFMLVNREAFNIHVKLWDGTIAAGTQIAEFTVGAQDTFAVTDLVGMEFSTSVNFEVEDSFPTGSAFSAGAALFAGGYLVDT